MSANGCDERFYVVHFLAPLERGWEGHLHVITMVIELKLHTDSEIVKIHGKHGTNTKNNNFCLCSLITKSLLVGYPLNFSGQ